MERNGCGGWTSGWVFDSEGGGGSEKPILESLLSDLSFYPSIYSFCSCYLVNVVFKILNFENTVLCKSQSQHVEIHEKKRRRENREHIAWEIPTINMERRGDILVMVLMVVMVVAYGGIIELLLFRFVYYFFFLFVCSLAWFSAILNVARYKEIVIWSLFSFNNYTQKTDGLFHE